MNKYYLNILEKFFVRNHDKYDYLVDNINKIDLGCIDNDINQEIKNLLKNAKARCIDSSKEYEYIKIEIDFDPNDWSNSKYYYYYIKNPKIIKDWQKFKNIDENWYIASYGYEENMGANLNL